MQPAFTRIVIESADSSTTSQVRHVTITKLSLCLIRLTAELGLDLVLGFLIDDIASSQHTSSAKPAQLKEPSGKQESLSTSRPSSDPHPLTTSSPQTLAAKTPEFHPTSPLRARIQTLLGLRNPDGSWDCNDTNISFFNCDEVISHMQTVFKVNDKVMMTILALAWLHVHSKDLENAPMKPVHEEVLDWLCSEGGLSPGELVRMENEAWLHLVKIRMDANRGQVDLLPGAERGEG